MEEQKIIKQYLFENLPYGSFTRIAKAVNKKFKKNISVAQVRNVCHPDMSSWDSEVIAEAQSILVKRNEEIIRAKEAMV